MELKTFKYKFLFALSRLLPGKAQRMFFKEYLKRCDSTPELAKEIWQCMRTNYKLCLKYRKEYKIISLGQSCLSRTLTTLWMLKPSRGAGEKSMPFDLVGSPAGATADFLSNDFADYFGDWSYDHENGYWYQNNGVYYIHDEDCGSDQEGLKKLRRRMDERINNFREAIAFEGPLLFVMHRTVLAPWEGRNFDGPADVERVCREIVRIRGGKPFKILVLVCSHDDSCEKIEGAEVIKLPYPYKEYIWHKDERFSPEGTKFEISLITACRNALTRLLQENNVIPR